MISLIQKLTQPNIPKHHQVKKINPGIILYKYALILSGWQYHSHTPTLLKLSW